MTTQTDRERQVWIDKAIGLHDEISAICLIHSLTRKVSPDAAARTRPSGD